MQSKAFCFIVWPDTVLSISLAFTTNVVCQLYCRPGPRWRSLKCSQLFSDFIRSQYLCSFERTTAKKKIFTKLNFPILYHLKWFSSYTRSIRSFGNMHNNLEHKSHKNMWTYCSTCINYLRLLLRVGVTLFWNFDHLSH